MYTGRKEQKQRKKGVLNDCNKQVFSYSPHGNFNKYKKNLLHKLKPVHKTMPEGFVAISSKPSRPCRLKQSPFIIMFCTYTEPPTLLQTNGNSK